MASNPNNAVVPAAFGAGFDKTALMALDPNWKAGEGSDLAAGIRASFGVIRYKGKVWSLRYNGESRAMLRTDGSGDPISSLEVVIVQASPHISKTYYEGRFQEGDDGAPDCFSLDGIRPPDNVPKKQCDTCALCPKNVWGSAVNDLGNKVKACSDSRRVAVVPLGDLDNKMFGGPLLLRVPPASLNAAAKYGRQVDAVNFPLHAIGTRIGFDHEQAYPSFVFSAIRPLDAAEFKVVVAMRDSDQVKQILFDSTAAVTSAGVAGVDPAVSALAGLKPAALTPAATQPLATESEEDEEEQVEDTAAKQRAALEAQLAELQRQDAAKLAQAQAEAAARAEREREKAEQERFAREAEAQRQAAIEQERAAAAAANAAQAAQVEVPKSRTRRKAAEAPAAAPADNAEDTIAALQARIAALTGGTPVATPEPVKAEPVQAQQTVKAEPVTPPANTGTPAASTVDELDDMLAGIAGV